MAAISSEALGKLDNKRGFNGNELQNKEFFDGSGLELYDFNARTYDQQIGRFIQIDPMTDEGGQESLSPYHFSYNNPIRYDDPDGRCPTCLLTPGAKEKITEGLEQVAAAAAEVVDQALIVTGGVLNGMLNSVTFGLWPAEGPMGTDGYTSEDAERAQDASKYGQMATVPMTAPVNGLPGMAVAPVEGAPIKIPGSLPGSTTTVQSSSKSSGSTSNSSSSSTPKQSKVEKSTKTESVGGKYTKTTDVKPGKGPGQTRAEYVRYKNKDGRVIRTQKFTYDRANRFQHKKPMRGGPEGRPQND